MKNLNTVVHGDCLEEMDKLIALWIKVDAIITDPPYWTTACKWDSIIPFDAMWERLNKLIKPNGAIVLFGSEPFSSALRMSNIKNYKYDWIYVKSQAQNFLNAKKQPLRNHENISVFYKEQCTYNPIKTAGKPYSCKSGKGGNSISADNNITKGGHVTINTGERFPLSVMEKIATENGLHPTQKPVALMEYLIKTYTNEWETILDFTAGSGSTLVAAKNTNRNFIGIEKEQEYIDIINTRLSSKLSGT